MTCSILSTNHFIAQKKNLTNYFIVVFLLLVAFSLRPWLQEAQLHPLLQVLQRRQRDETAQERLRSQGHSQPVQGLARQLAILNVMLQQSEREKIYFRYIFIRRSDSFNIETTE